jgi:hypothetical protein
MFKNNTNSNSQNNINFNTNEANSSSSSCSNIPFMNPFEESNRYRLEQSVLSPNIFHVAQTSTPEVRIKTKL